MNDKGSGVACLESERRSDADDRKARLSVSARSTRALVDSDDAELLEGIRAGRRDAWDETVRRHSGRLWALARSRGLNAAESQDALQGVWLSLLDNADRIRDPAALRSWLTIVIKNEATRLGRVGQRETARATRLAGQPETRSSPADAEVERTADLERLAAAMALLPDRCRRLLTLMFSAADLSYVEIAETMGTAVGSLGPTRARCLQRLHDLFMRTSMVSTVAAD